MADEDNFDIDIYGDLDNDPPATTTNTYNATNNQAAKKDDDDLLLDDMDEATQIDSTQRDPHPTQHEGHPADHQDNTPIKIGSTQDDHSQARKKVAAKRKYPDDRPIENGATTALYVSDLHWWSTDDDIRGWVSACECEDELKDITFNEHKVNGKSKG